MCTLLLRVCVIILFCRNLGLFSVLNSSCYSGHFGYSTSANLPTVTTKHLMWMYPANIGRDMPPPVHVTLILWHDLPLIPLFPGLVVGDAFPAQAKQYSGSVFDWVFQARSFGRQVEYAHCIRTRQTVAVHAGRAYGTHYVFTVQARAGASRGGPRLDWGQVLAWAECRYWWRTDPLRPRYVCRVLP